MFFFCVESWLLNYTEFNFMIIPVCPFNVLKLLTSLLRKKKGNNEISISKLSPLFQQRLWYKSVLILHVIFNHHCNILLEQIKNDVKKFIYLSDGSLIMLYSKTFHLDTRVASSTTGKNPWLSAGDRRIKNFKSQHCFSVITIITQTD